MSGTSSLPGGRSQSVACADLATNPMATLFLLAHVNQLFFSLLVPFELLQNRGTPTGREQEVGTRAVTAPSTSAIS
jgi:hypothetical protein